MLVLRRCGYRFRGASTPALSAIDLDVAPGERVLVAGPSGCGKSTLLRLASGLLAAHGAGDRTGEVRVDGRDPAALSPRERAAVLGFVGQDPADQLVAGAIADEVAFGLESLAVPADRIAPAVARALAEVGLDLPHTRDPHALSGGQQQRLGVAAALAAGGKLLLLDEPLARLDADGADALLRTLTALSAAGVTVVLAEHRLARCLPFATRTVLLDAGRVVFDGADPPEAELARLGLRAPLGPIPLRDPGPPILSLRAPALGHGGAPVLRGVEVEVRRGERIAVVGPNGSGKSTLLGALAGRLHPRSGDARVVEVPQDPDLALFGDTVADELAYAPREAGHGPDEVWRGVDPVATALRLDGLRDRAPQALSSGERLRLAVGAALTASPDVLLLDEPTAGQDAAAVHGLLAALDAAAPDAAVVFATHDRALATAAAHRVIEVAPWSVAAEAVAAAPDRSGGLDPRTRLGLLAAVGVLAVVLDRPIVLGLLAAGSGAVLFALPQARGWRWRALGLAAALTWATTLSQALFYADLPRVPLVQIGPIAVWREGITHGLAQSMRLLAAAFAGIALTVSTPTDRLVAGLGALRVPWSVGLLAAVALRAIPLVGTEWAQVRRARAARGRPVYARGPAAWLALEARLLRPVAARALRRARALALSLDARGFDPEAPRTRRVPLRAGGWDLAVIAPVWTVALAAIGLELLYRAYLAEALYLPALRPVYGWVRTWL